jgi:argininosuccinate synthase
MKRPVVLAFAGGIRASAAIPWLVDTMGVDVVTVRSTSDKVRW